MTEQTNTPPNQPPSEEDIQEFMRKFDEWYGTLSDREKLQAASVVVLSAEEASSDEESVEENQTVEPLSDEEIEAFSAKLQSFHDGLPEGQHQILDTLAATAFVHSLPEEERDDVQGNEWLWTRGITLVFKSPAFYSRLNEYKSLCHKQGGILKYRYRNSAGTPYYGCWWDKFSSPPKY
jgi:hypothetical protein